MIQKIKQLFCKTKLSQAEQEKLNCLRGKHEYGKYEKPHKEKRYLGGTSSNGILSQHYDLKFYQKITCKFCGNFKELEEISFKEYCEATQN
jgi:hypothetical protein